MVEQPLKVGPRENVWAAPLGSLSLLEGEVHVWRASLNQRRRTLEQLLTLLAPDEASRAERFYRQRHRDDFIAARGILRKLVSAYLHTPPARLRFTYGSHGKPAMCEGQGAAGLRFNLSHSGSLALYAFARGREVGIDVEHMREEFAGLDIAERFFSAAEVTKLTSLPRESRVQAFYNCWSRKEAYIKALGEGLSHPLSCFTVALAPREGAALLAVEGDARELSRWKMYDLPAGDGYAAALVVESPSAPPKHWQWGE